jgi:hypothetical protein
MGKYHLSIWQAVKELPTMLINLKNKLESTEQKLIKAYLH